MAPRHQPPGRRHTTPGSPVWSTRRRIRAGRSPSTGGARPTSFDPGNTYYAADWDFARFYSTTLMTFKNCPGACGKTLVPALATAPGTVSDNGLTWTYHIKSGVKFQDGTPVTSQDVKYAVERTFDRGVLANGPNYFQTLLGGNAASYPGPYKDKSKDKMGLTAIDTPDSTTVVFHLAKPFSDFNYLATIPQTAPVPPDKDTGASYQTHIVSTGPYKFQSYQLNKTAVLVPNPQWNAAHEPDRLAAGQQDRRQHEHEPQRRRQPAAGRRRPGRLRGHRRAGGGAGQDPGQPQPQGPIGQPAHRVRLVLLHRLAGGAVHQPRLPAGGRVRGQPHHAAERLRRPGRRRRDRQHGHAADHCRLPEVRPLQCDHEAPGRPDRGQAEAAGLRPAERLLHRDRLPQRPADRDRRAPRRCSRRCRRSASRPRCTGSRRRRTTPTSPACRST